MIHWNIDLGHSDLKFKVIQLFVWTLSENTDSSELSDSETFDFETCFQVNKFIWDHELSNKLRYDLDNDPVADFGRFGGQAVNRNTGTLSYNFLNDFHLPSSKPPIWLVGINVPDRPIDQTVQ